MADSRIAFRIICRLMARWSMSDGHERRSMATSMLPASAACGHRHLLRRLGRLRRLGGSRLRGSGSLGAGSSTGAARRRAPRSTTTRRLLGLDGATMSSAGLDRTRGLVDVGRRGHHRRRDRAAPAARAVRAARPGRPASGSVSGMRGADQRQLEREPRRRGPAHVVLGGQQQRDDPRELGRA